MKLRGLPLHPKLSLPQASFGKVTPRFVSPDPKVSRESVDLMAKWWSEDQSTEKSLESPASSSLHPKYYYVYSRRSDVCIARLLHISKPECKKSDFLGYPA